MLSAEAPRSHPGSPSHALRWSGAAMVVCSSRLPCIPKHTTTQGRGAEGIHFALLGSPASLSTHFLKIWVCILSPSLPLCAKCVEEYVCLHFWSAPQGLVTSTLQYRRSFVQITHSNLTHELVRIPHERRSVQRMKYTALYYSPCLAGSPTALLTALSFCAFLV